MIMYGMKCEFNKTLKKFYNSYHVIKVSRLALGSYMDIADDGKVV